MPVFQLDEQVWFPKPELAEEDGLLAIGGDLSVERLLFAYSNGIFPWYNPGEEIMWWCPKTRYVIYPNQIHISHSMKKFIKKTNFTVTINQNFREVMYYCRTTREFKEGTWISNEMEEAYNRLFQHHYALSVEVWRQTKLVGGLYGVSLGYGFFGESMFSIEANASKFALISLAKLLDSNQYGFIDCQFHTEHLESMGGTYVSWEEYQQLLHTYVIE